MKIMFASDIHGSAYYCRKLIERYQEEKPEKMILLGDLLYHGPRNDLPEEYAPKKVIAMLNEIREELLCVRGNCEAEVDQMVLEFPVLADYMVMFEKGRMFFITHGHVYNKENLPMLKKGDLLIHGHTHIQAMEDCGDFTYINPGSVSIPKAGNQHSYMMYEDGIFSIKNLAGEEIMSYTLCTV
ncbi:MAG: phosphodiesterase [Lachnospiraceae bacterium]|nr:phosphodiesterase [Lachnospiraceae bacterium]